MNQKEMTLTITSEKLLRPLESIEKFPQRSGKEGGKDKEMK